MAVEGAYRRRGIARLWVAARTSAFFLAHGFAAVTSSRERDILVREFPRCEQVGRSCEPRAPTKRLDDTGPPNGPPSEGETWHDRD